MWNKGLFCCFFTTRLHLEEWSLAVASEMCYVSLMALVFPLEQVSPSQPQFSWNLQANQIGQHPCVHSRLFSPSSRGSLSQTLWPIKLPTRWNQPSTSPTNPRPPQQPQVCHSKGSGHKVFTEKKLTEQFLEEPEVPGSNAALRFTS